MSLSLQGLSEQEAAQKLNKALSEMGDAFASLIPGISSLNELMGVAQQRYGLNTRLLQLQGNEEELLRRQREQELAVVHPLNRATLEHIYALEDQLRAEQQAKQQLQQEQQQLQQAQQQYNSALGDLRNIMTSQIREATRAVSGAESDLQGAMSSAMDAAIQTVSDAESDLQKAIDAEVETINSSFDAIIENLNAGLDAAKEKAAQSNTIFELLDRSLRSRSLQSEQNEFRSRQSALQYVTSGGVDIDKLSDALSVLNAPSQKFFGTFQDYARDFALTSNAIEKSRDIAESTMTADELAVKKLEEQIEQSNSDRELQISQVEGLVSVDETVLSVEQAVNALREATADRDLIAKQHEELIEEFPQLSENVLSVEQAVNALREATTDRDLIVKQHEELISQFPDLNQSVLSIAAAVNNLANAQRAVSKAETKVSNAEKAAEMEKHKSILISGDREDPVLANPFYRNTEEAILNAAKAAGIETSGRIGLQITREVSKAYGVRVAGLPIRKRYAQGGFHTGGIRMVGEQGPELEATGPARIFSNRQTAEMFRDPELTNEVRNLRSEVAGLRTENAQLLANNNKYTKRSYDLYRKWDVDGQPPERT